MASTEEEWRPVIGWEGYEVSNHGRVRSYRRPGRGTDIRDEPHELTTILNGGGYLQVNLCVNGRKKVFQVHRLVASTFLTESWFEGAYVLHGDGDKQNNHVDNLRWGTAAENSADRVVHGTLGISRSVEQIEEIKRLYAMGFQQREIARVFKTTQNYVHELVTGKKRKDVA